MLARAMVLASVSELVLAWASVSMMAMVSATASVSALGSRPGAQS
jgi:hypothetical protein